jgi:hypothetical protein
LEFRKRAGEIVSYKYEPIKLRLADNTYYIPDFEVVYQGHDEQFVQFHEVKGGFIRKMGWTKLKIAADLYPEFSFMLCQCIKGEWRFQNL